MALCSDCQALSPYELLSRPVHQPGEEDGIDVHFYTLKNDFSLLLASSEHCPLCALVLHDLTTNYALETLRNAVEDGTPTPIQIAANSSTGTIEDKDSVSEVAKLSTLWVCCGALPSREEEDKRSAKLSLLLAAREGKSSIHGIFIFDMTGCCGAQY
jgi:hypothetical protein